MHGQFVWYELTTPDVDAAIRFYPRFTGWGTQRFDENYVMWTMGGLPFAGIFRLNDEMHAQGIPPNWMPYVETDDVDATASRATSLGASITAGPGDIPGTGRFAVIQDPQGAVFGIYRSFNRSIAWDGRPVLGRFSWHELMTTDHVAAATFYEALFGWRKISEMDMGGGEMYHMFGQDGNMYGGMFTTPRDMAGMQPFWLVYINVRDVGKAVEVATKHGAMVHRPQMDIPGGSIAILGDPQGAGFALHHVTVPAAASEPPAKKAAPEKAAKKASARSSAPATRARAKSKSKAKAKTKTKTKTKPRKKTKTKTRARTNAKARPVKKTPSRARKSATTTARRRGKAKAKK